MSIYIHNLFRRSKKKKKKVQEIFVVENHHCPASVLHFIPFYFKLTLWGLFGSGIVCLRLLKPLFQH